MVSLVDLLVPLVFASDDAEGLRMDRTQRPLVSLECALELEGRTRGVASRESRWMQGRGRGTYGLSPGRPVQLFTQADVVIA